MYVFWSDDVYLGIGFRTKLCIFGFKFHLHIYFKYIYLLLMLSFNVL